MIMRLVGAVALFLMTLSSEAYATRQHRPARRISCSEVRYYVAKYSEPPVAEMYARSRGATDVQIERARRCLASGDAAEAVQRRSYME